MTWLVVWFDRLLPVAAVVGAYVTGLRLGRASARVEHLIAELGQSQSRSRRAAS